MIDLIIKKHQEIFINNNYTLIDPDSKTNELKQYKPSQDEIIKFIKENDLNNVIIKYGKYIYNYIFDNKNDIKIIPLNINSIHIIRLLKYDSFILTTKIKFDHILYSLNFHIEQNDFIFNLCTICGSDLEYKGFDKINCCKKKTCLIEFKHVPVDNKITDLYKKDPFLCELLINILIYGTRHPKKDKIFKLLPIVDNFDNLIKLVKKESNNLVISKINCCSNDVELYDLIGKDAYALMSYAIMDNYFSLSTIRNFETSLLNIKKLKITDNVFDSSDVKFIGFNYSYEIETKFKKKYFLFHGTPLHSWYPIIKNGLRVMSGTEFQVNGAAHGKGIYFSDSFSMSDSYATSSDAKTNIKKIIGVFEILEEPTKYKKSEEIFVIDDDTKILLRYLIVCTNCLSSSYSEELTNYFIKYLGSINKINDDKSIKIKNKRFDAEMKLLNINKKIINITIIDETTKWIVELDKIKNIHVKLIVHFNDYPKFPPKISIDSDVNPLIIKNICDENLNIIISELTPYKWEITYNLSKIVDIIHNHISNLVV